MERPLGALRWLRPLYGCRVHPHQVSSHAGRSAALVLDEPTPLTDGVDTARLPTRTRLSFAARACSLFVACAVCRFSREIQRRRHRRRTRCCKLGVRDRAQLVTVAVLAGIFPA